MGDKIEKLHFLNKMIRIMLNYIVKLIEKCNYE